MLIKRVRIGAFGAFSERTMELAPGMTVIVGDNESGKTTWHAAIFAALCGMRRGAGKRAEDRDFTSRHRPWDGGGWSVESELVLADGREIEIVQELDGHIDCRAVDVGLGRRDVSDEIMFEGSPDASRWLGLDRRTFPATACVNQAEVSYVVESASALQEHLQRAAATAGADQTAARALALIDEFRAEHVGQDRANAVKPLRRAVVRVADAERFLEVARRAHEMYLVQLETVDRLESEAAAARYHLDLLNAAAAVREAARVRTKVDQARALEAELEGEQIDLEAVRRATDRVSGAIAAWRSAPEPVPLAGPPSAELERELSALPAAPIGDLSPATAVVDAETAWRAASKALEAHSAAAPAPAPSLPTTLSVVELRELARDLSVTVPQVDAALEQAHQELERRLAALPERRVSVPLLIAAGVISALAVVAGLLTTPVVLVAGLLVGAGLVVLAIRNTLRDPRATLLTRLRENESRLGPARLAADAARKTISAAEARAVTAGVPAEPTRVIALAGEVESFNAAAERRRQWETAYTEHGRAVQQAASALRAALIDRGLGEPADLAGAVNEYRAACASRAHIAEQAARRPQLERELETRRHAEAEADAARKRHETAEQVLAEAAREQGLAATDPGASVAALVDWQEANRERLARGQRQARARGELDSLLAGRSSDDVARAADEARLHAVAASADLPSDQVDSLAGAAALDADLVAGRTAVESAHVAAATARGELKQLSGDSASVSAAEEGLDAAKAELERVRRLETTLSRTHELLERAQERVHRDIAPVLENTLREWLPRVTAGRYTDASVDPEVLIVKVKDLGGTFRDADLLSQGTLEQIYLLLRMALVEHLTKPGETSPLIFDDVTAQTDSTRTVAILDLLHEISHERQVIVFSQEEDVRRWAEINLGQERDVLVRLEVSGA